MAFLLIQKLQLEKKRKTNIEQVKNGIKLKQYLKRNVYININYNKKTYFYMQYVKTPLISYGPQCTIIFRGSPYLMYLLDSSNCTYVDKLINVHETPLSFE